MAQLDPKSGPFDLIWCEGAIYNIGVGVALQNWKPYLLPTSRVVFTELVWLVDQPSEEVAKFFGLGYPEMSSIEANKRLIESEGYETLADFTLPDQDWWDCYYSPLEAKLPMLRETYHKDDEALALIEMTAAEIDMRRRFATEYGYHCFITGRSEPNESTRSTTTATFRRR